MVVWKERMGGVEWSGVEWSGVEWGVADMYNVMCTCYSKGIWYRYFI